MIDKFRAKIEELKQSAGPYPDENAPSLRLWWVGYTNALAGMLEFLETLAAEMRNAPWFDDMQKKHNQGLVSADHLRACFFPEGGEAMAKLPLPGKVTLGFCWYDPTIAGEAILGSAHKEKATWVLGDNEWRLCDSCAALPKFANFRTRQRIVAEK